MESMTCRESFNTEIIETFNTTRQKLAYLSAKFVHYRKAIKLRFASTNSNIYNCSSRSRNHNVDYCKNQKIQKPLKRAHFWTSVYELKSRVKRLSIRTSASESETTPIESSEKTVHSYQADDGKSNLFTSGSNEIITSTGEQQSDDQDIVRTPTAPYDYTYGEDFEYLSPSDYSTKNQFCSLPIVFETDQEACGGPDAKKFDALCEEVASLAINCGNNSEETFPRGLKSV